MQNLLNGAEKEKNKKRSHLHLLVVVLGASETVSLYSLV